ncbi:hypothetical protein, partial [Mesorhizobium marinum]|uniref:hypothetical protein n=1 Tax=Mesorhizobium marinum TaxID=3228790 RepID=UPI0034678AC6
GKKFNGRDGLACKLRPVLARRSANQLPRVEARAGPVEQVSGCGIDPQIHGGGSRGRGDASLRL